MKHPARLHKSPKRLFQLIILACTTMLMISCGGDSEPGSPGTNPPQTGDTPTYHGQISAILYDNCVSCHQDGGIAPFSFVLEEKGLEAAVAHASSIKRDALNRSMPPWLADNSGQCNNFEHARWLSDTDIDTISRWADNGKPEGTPPASPLTYSPPPGLRNPSGVAADRKRVV